MAVGIQTEVSEYTPPQAQQLRNTEKYQACFTTGLIASSQEGHSAGNYQNLEQLPLLTQMMSSRVPSLSSHHYIWYQSPRLRKFPAWLPLDDCVDYRDSKDFSDQHPQQVKYSFSEQHPQQVEQQLQWPQHPTGRATASVSTIPYR